MAKLKLIGLVPGVIGLERILEHMNEGEEKKDFAVLDLGTKALRMHFFRKGIYDTTRTMEPGCEEIEQIRRGDKEQLVQLNVDDDDTFWGKKGEKTLDEALSNRYQTIVVQAMRVLNFYSFNNSDNTIDSLYYCGGGARYKGLIDTLSDTVGIPVKSIGEILPELDAKEDAGMDRQSSDSRSITCIRRKTVMDLKKIAKMQIGGPKYPDKKKDQSVSA